MHGSPAKHASDDFMDRIEGLCIGLEYDDVKMLSNESSVLPHQTDTRTYFSRSVPLKIPVVSAAMDRVTESPMAIALAKLGGIGVIHRNLSPKDQAAEVRKVKRHLNGLIDHPVLMRTQQTIADVLSERERLGLTCRKFPVVDHEGKLAGWLTRDQFDFCNDEKQKVEAVMAPLNGIVAPLNTTLEQAWTIMCEKRVRMLPLVNGDGRPIAMYVFSDVRRIMKEPNSFFNVDKNGRLRVAAAVGVSDAFERCSEFPDDIDAVVIDTAHAHTSSVVETVKKLRDGGLKCDLVVGNISRKSAALRLIDEGADGLKVGQGPGSICTTQSVSGVGRGQFTAVHECARAARRAHVPVCADGGIRESAHIVRAIGAGASSVMLGSLLAGCDESPGEVILVNGTRMKRYRGMGSVSAMSERWSADRYHQGGVSKDKFVPEGVEALVPYNGTLNDVMRQLIGGLQAGMGYAGARAIRELQECAEFERATHVGVEMAHPHSVLQITEAPNFRR